MDDDDDEPILRVFARALGMTCPRFYHEGGRVHLFPEDAALAALVQERVDSARVPGRARSPVSDSGESCLSSLSGSCGGEGVGNSGAMGQWLRAHLTIYGGGGFLLGGGYPTIP